MHQTTKTRQVLPRPEAPHGYSDRLQRYRLEAGRSAEGSGEKEPRLSRGPLLIFSIAGVVEDVGAELFLGDQTIGSPLNGDSRSGADAI